MCRGGRFGTGFRFGGNYIRSCFTSFAAALVGESISAFTERLLQRQEANPTKRRRAQSATKVRHRLPCKWQRALWMVKGGNVASPSLECSCSPNALASLSFVAFNGLTPVWRTNGRHVAAMSISPRRRLHRSRLVCQVRRSLAGSRGSSRWRCWFFGRRRLRISPLCQCRGA